MCDQRALSVAPNWTKTQKKLETNYKKTSNKLQPNLKKAMFGPTIVLLEFGLWGCIFESVPELFRARITGLIGAAGMAGWAAWSGWVGLAGQTKLAGWASWAGWAGWLPGLAGWPDLAGWTCFFQSLPDFWLPSKCVGVLRRCRSHPNLACPTAGRYRPKLEKNFKKTTKKLWPPNSKKTRNKLK